MPAVGSAYAQLLPRLPHPGLIGHGAYYELVDAEGVCIVGKVLDVGQRMFVGDIGVCLA